MRHLSRPELVDLAEGVLTAERAAHVGECARCRQEADALRRIAVDVRAVEMPEPSPLFWGHLSAQIHAAVDCEPQPRRVYDAAAHNQHWWSSRLRSLSPNLRSGPTRALAVAFVAVMMAGWWWLAASRSSVSSEMGPLGTGPAPVSTSPAAARTNTAPRIVQPESLPAATPIEPVSPDASWELVSSLADREGMLDEEGLAVAIAPGAAERALLSLTAEEQRELARLLDEAMARGLNPESRIPNPES